MVTCQNELNMNIYVLYSFTLLHVYTGSDLSFIAKI